jgi:hypothetical protein
MPTCNECASYQPKSPASGECRINGTTEPDRDIGRCPSRTFIPKAAK